jgi:hypothetical protein
VRSRVDVAHVAQLLNHDDCEHHDASYCRIYRDTHHNHYHGANYDRGTDAVHRRIHYHRIYYHGVNDRDGYRIYDRGNDARNYY